MYLLCVLSRVSTSFAFHHHTNIARLGSEPLVHILLKVASSALAALHSLPALDDTRGGARLGLFPWFRVPSVTLYIYCISLHNIASHRILIALLLLYSHYTNFCLLFLGHGILRKSNP